MGIRRNIGGRYVEVREKNSSKGKRGTIMKNWTSKKKNVVKNKNNFSNIIIFILILVLIFLIYFYFFK